MSDNEECLELGALLALGCSILALVFSLTVLFLNVFGMI